MKFIHAADLHLDSPLRGLDAYEGAPVERLRGASRLALSALVDLALAQQVACVLLAGDIYDGDWADFRTGLYFREQMVRLCRAGVRVFIVKGNHDAASQITRQLPEVEGVHLFSAQRAESVELPGLGVVVHGRSFPNRAVPEDLVPQYPAPWPGHFNIGVLHTSLTGREGHDPYAPTTVDVLRDKGYDYFALGHVHAREVVHERAPRIVFPGNLQGRHAKETGPKGCELVTVEGGAIVAAEFVALDVVRWHQLTLDVAGLSTLADLARACAQAMRRAAAEAPERLHAMRVHLAGRSVLHAVEAAQPGTLAAAVQAAAQDLDGLDVWIESVPLALASPRDRAAEALRDDAVGEVVRLVDEWLADPDALQAWYRGQVDGMRALPGILADADPATRSLDEIRQALLDAEATVLARIGEASAADGRADASGTLAPDAPGEGQGEAAA